MKNVLKGSSSFGKMQILIGLLLIFPIGVIPFYKEDIVYLASFLIPAIVSALLGLLLCILQGNKEAVESAVDNTVLLTWIYGFIVGATPFIISAKLSVVQSLFESVSGWTTTGLSVMDVSVTPHIFLFYRAFMQFCGGLGFVMVMISFIQGKQSMNLYNAEGHSDRLMPNIGKTARLICKMYIIFLGIGTVAYCLCGMPFFDSITNAMCALSTGGFSTQIESIGAYNSIAIEAVTIVLMLIGTTNFAVLLLLTRGKIKQVLKVSEVRFMFGLLTVLTPITGIILVYGLCISIGEGMRQSVFNVVSALSTSGFSTMPYNNWPEAAIGIMILLMLIGGGIGSTAGGIKLTRIYIALRMMKENIRRRLHPARTIRNPYYYRAQGKTYIDRNVESDTTGFIFCYFIIYILGTLILTVTANCSLRDAMFEFASSLGTVGLSIGITGPNTNALTLIVEMMGMMLGRLEIFIVFTGVINMARGRLFHKIK